MEVAFAELRDVFEDACSDTVRALASSDSRRRGNTVGTKFVVGFVRCFGNAVSR